MTRLWFLLALLCISCSSVERVKFRVLAINNTDETEVPCVILADNRLLTDDKNQPLLTPAEVTLEFKSGGDANGYESVDLGVRAVVLDAEKNVVSGLEEGEPSPYFPDSRHVYWNDAKTQLFILRLNRG